LSISESRSKFQGKKLSTIESTGAAQSITFSTFSTYSRFTFLDNIDFLRTYSSIPSSQSHISVQTGKYALY